MSPSANPLFLILDIFRAPTACFAALYQKGKWAWFPYLLLIFSPLVFWDTYFSMVNFDWLIQSLLAAIGPVDAQVQQDWLNKEVLLAGEVFNDVFGRTASILMLAFWFKLATKPSQYQHSYFKWVAACTIIMFPAIIGDLASYVNLLMNHAHVLPGNADLNSLNGLVKLPLNNPWATYTSAFPLLMPWYIVLSYAAIGAWTDFDKAKALTIALLPWLVCFTVWPLFIAIL